MRDFIAIDFETGNPKRVSACAIGYARVADGQLIETNGYLINPVGGHAPFQSKIHGIKEEHTKDKPNFGELFPEIKDIFQYPLVAHSLFDQQVLKALSDHFGLGLVFSYTDTSAIAKQLLPDLKNHKLKTLAKHFELPKFKHHDARDDAIACANIYLMMQNNLLGETPTLENDDAHEFKGLIKGILADNIVNYKEAYELLYWLEDHVEITSDNQALYALTKTILEDDELDDIEASMLRRQLLDTLITIENTGE